jgi:DNA-binding MarR family transcriptional regulator
MTNAEFDVLDELYFLQAYKELVETLKMSDSELKSILENLLKRGWIKCYLSPLEEKELDISDLEKEYWNYHYLATKAGLLAHNSNF